MAIDPIDTKLIDTLLAGGKKAEDIIGKNGLLKQLTKALLERAMHAELTEHVGYEKHDPTGNNSGNSRNGTSKKKLKGDFGEIDLETPRDRNGSFEPQIIAKNQTRFAGFDDKIISMYSRGMTTREIEGHLKEMRYARKRVRCGRVAGADLQRHRSRDGRSEDVAEPAAGGDLRHPVPGRATGENS
jgi:transposase-like protein